MVLGGAKLARLAEVGAGVRRGLASLARSPDVRPPPTEDVGGGDGTVRWEEAKPFNLMPGPKGWPFVGSLSLYTKGPYSIDKFHEAQLELHRKYGKIYKQTIAGKTAVHLFDPDYIQAIYQTEGKVPHIPPLQEGTQLYRKHRDMSLGLGNSNGDDWYRVRSSVQQMMMRPQAVSQYFPLVNEVADALLMRMSQVRCPDTGQVPDFNRELLLWNLESSAMTCFERRLGCMGARPGSWPQKLVDANAAIFKHNTTMKFVLPWHRFFPTKLWKKLLEAEDFFFGEGQKLVDGTVEKVKELISRGELEEGRFAFITYLLSKPDMTYKDLSVISLSLFADGLSTTVPSLIGQLYCLATNQEKQDKLYEEIQRVTSSGREELSAAIINRMSYLKAAVKEGFRFFPIGPDVSRITKKNLVIGGYQIPAETTVHLHNNQLLRMSEYFDDPDVYRPERWLRTDEDIKTHPYLLMPFSFGPRMCAGRRFAEQEMYVVISKILQRYRIEWPSRDPMEQRYVILLTPDKPAAFRFLPRE